MPYCAPGGENPSLGSIFSCLFSNFPKRQLPTFLQRAVNSTPAQPVFKVGNREYECDEYPNYLKRTLIILMKDEERTLYSPSLFHQAQVVYSDTQGLPSPVDTTNLDQVCPVLPYVFPYLISCRYGSTGCTGTYGVPLSHCG